MATVSLHDVHKRFGETDVIKGVDLGIDDREFAVFVGPSGCGKSTLLRLIAGLEEITSGDLLIDGHKVNDVPPAERGLAMVFQTYALYPHMTVRDNMAFSLRLAGMSKAERQKKVDEAAKVLQLEPLLDRKPKELSGGQRQRVAIGRAIVRSPKVFLFDEPLSNLDAALRVQMRIEIARLHESLNATMIYVTHDQVEAMTMADKIVVLRDGIIEQVGSPLELYHHPRNIFVAGFIGSPKMNFVPSRITALDQGGATVTLPGGGLTAVPIKTDGVESGDAVTVGFRPEHVDCGDDGQDVGGQDAGGQIPGEVLVVERLGGDTYLHVQIESSEMIVVQVSGDSPIRVHERVNVIVPGVVCHLFRDSGDAIPSAELHSLVATRLAGPAH